MTPAQAKVGFSIAVFLWAWWRGRARAKAPTGSVDVGTPTVSGPGSDRWGGTDYGVQPGMLDTPVRILTNDAADRIAAFDAENPDAPESGDYGRIN